MPSDEVLSIELAFATVVASTLLVELGFATVVASTLSVESGFATGVARVNPVGGTTLNS